MISGQNPMCGFGPRSPARLNRISRPANPADHYLTPKDVATIYDINAAYNAGYTGTGQSIAVMGQSEISVSDIENFQSAAGLTVKDPTVVLVPSSGTCGGFLWRRGGIGPRSGVFRRHRQGRDDLFRLRRQQSELQRVGLSPIRSRYQNCADSQP